MSTLPVLVEGTIRLGDDVVQFTVESTEVESTPEAISKFLSETIAEYADAMLEEHNKPFNFDGKMLSREDAESVVVDDFARSIRESTDESLKLWLSDVGFPPVREIVDETLQDLLDSIHVS